jgi:hypothetical protein
MQKVEGSSPFSRFGKGPQRGPFVYPASMSMAGVSRNRVPNKRCKTCWARRTRTAE